MTTLEGQKYTDRDLIESIVSNFFIIDYGYISKVNADGTVNVCHAKKMVTIDGTEMPAMYTNNIELLTLSGEEFSFKYTVKQGDKVILLGLKNWIETVDKVESPTSQECYLHYSRETMKAFPLCTFNGDAKVTVTVDGGKAEVMASSEIDIDGSDNGGLVIGPELKTQLGYLTARVDAIINALENSAVAAQDGGQTYKTNITAALNLITNKEDFSNIESTTVKHGKGPQ